MRPWLAPAAVALLASAFPLVQVELDRAGPPHATVQLTQGELGIGYTSDENSGLELTWNWWGQGTQMDSVPEELFRTLGFRCDRTTDTCSFGHGQRGWVAVAIDSMQWQRAVEKARVTTDSTWRALPDSARKSWRAQGMSTMEYAVFNSSRLRIEGVAADPATLWQRWNDGNHLILPANLSAWRASWPRDTLPGAVRYYRVTASPTPSSVYVPAEWAKALRDSTGVNRQLYRVKVAVGARWLLRVVEVTPVPLPPTRADSLRLFGLDWQ